MSTFKSKKKKLLEFRIFRKGDHVALANNSIYRGIVEEYLGLAITPEARGRTFRVKWSGPKIATTIHYDFELVLIQTKMRLKKRPLEEKLSGV